MRKFIEVYNMDDECVEFVNVDNIISVSLEEEDDDEYVYINLKGGRAFQVNASYRELVRMIGD